MMKQIRIYFNNKANSYPEYPFPIAREQYDNSKEVSFVEKLIENATHNIKYRGWSGCRICGKVNGIGESYYKLSDDIQLVIPDGYFTLCQRPLYRPRSCPTRIV